MAKKTFDTRLGVERSNEPPRRRGWRAIAGVAAIVLAAGAWWAQRRDGSTDGPPPAAPVPLTSLPGIETMPSFSPDGSRVAFAWNGGAEGGSGEIYVQRVGDKGPAARITNNPAQDDLPVWSPDGRSIAFRRSTGNAHTVFVIPADGGTERMLFDVPGLAVGIAWSPDGLYLAAAGWVPGVSNEIFLYSIERKEKRKLWSKEPPGFDAVGAFSPNGRYMAYTTHVNEGSEDVYLVEFRQDHSLKGAPRRLTQHGGVVRGVAWSPDGRSVIYSRSSTAEADAYLWRVRAFDGGSPVRVDVAGARAMWPSVSRRGNRLAYRAGGADYEIRRFVSGGAQADPVFSGQQDVNPQFSPDGKSLAFVSRRGDGRTAIWISDADGRNARQLTKGSEWRQGYPSWSPDGKRIAFDAVGESGTQDVFVVDAGGGEPRRLTQDPADDNLPVWSRDGKYIYFHSNRGRSGEILRIPAEGGAERPMTENGGCRPMVSHDGETLYYFKPMEGSVSVPLYARGVLGGPERKVLDATLGWGYWVAKDGIYYLTQSNRAGVYQFQLHAFGTGGSRLLGGIEGLMVRDPAVSPDGKTVLYSVAAQPKIHLMLVEGFR